MIFSLFVYRAWQSTGCTNYIPIRFQTQKVKLEVEQERQYDASANSSTARLFHNKVSSSSHQILLSLFSTLEPRYLLSLVGPLGVAGVMFVLYYGISHNRKVTFIALTLFLVAHGLSVLYLNPKTAMLVLSFLWFSALASGSKGLSKTPRLVVTFALLWLYTLWFFTVNWQLGEICNEIFFN